ncbi:hypothetical protein PMPD1_0628 [Paramixta manurensis]|uniref:DUF1311 domain-containing protein n=1 Tax=Paramixta manurensis TaxID=2740817 RepID=A0A6M8UD77_9GAMM|nr:hypothetical protein PMPD1_0628 [Erwiniaceae bacterium PD-1]
MKNFNFVYWRKMLFCLAWLFSFPALAVNCQRAATLIENTLCSSPELRWLDDNLQQRYQQEIITNPQVIWQQQQEWQKARDACVSNVCLQRAYLQRISGLSQADRSLKLEGSWWNKSAPNGNGGVLTFSRVSRWGYEMSATSWAGVNRVSLTGEGRLFYGISLVDNLQDARDCRILVIPRADGTLDVSSNSDYGCKIFVPQGIMLDGIYVRADSDPRPAASLLTLGIFPTREMDDRFRKLVGNDYENYVKTANSYAYSDDLDNQGATVMTLAVKGMANRKAALIRYTSSGKIWAMRVEPTPDNHLKFIYVTTEADKTMMPKTLSSWRQNFPG